MSQISELSYQRKKFHQELLEDGLVAINAKGIPSMADSSSRASTLFARGMVDAMGISLSGERLAGQSSGNKFEKSVSSYLSRVFPLFSNLRPGVFEIDVYSGARSISAWQQYGHLGELDKLTRESSELAAAIGRDYIVKPDVIVLRRPETDEIINSVQAVVDDSVAKRTGLRQVNNSKPILHASISCKWTMRSDRAQNARSEALNLIRNRKGRVPHIAVVTAEPMPARIASLALGTGDLDCVYHIALDELVQAVNSSDYDDSKEILSTMIEGDRLRDIADLPLDLAV